MGTGLGSDHAVQLISVLDQNQGRDARHPELPGRISILVDIELGDNHPPPVFPCQLLKHGSDLSARAAPGSPEVHQNRETGVDDPLGEVRIRHDNGL